MRYINLHFTYFTLQVHDNGTPTKVNLMYRKMLPLTYLSLDIR